MQARLHPSRNLESLCVGWCMVDLALKDQKHVIAIIKELFEKVLLWVIVVKFQILVDQAVAADLFGGDTIRHVLGIGYPSHHEETKTAMNNHEGFSKRVSQ